MSALAVCPDCRGALRPVAGGRRCGACGADWPDRDGLPGLVREARVRRLDRLLRVLYDGLPALHDPLTRHALPRLQRGGSERGMREAYTRRLALDALAGPTARVLEVGVGAGGSVPYLRRHAPPGVHLEVHGVDLSVGMLRQCRRKPVPPGVDLHLAVADAHHLPYPDAVFDRVLHVGAINGYGDPRLALAEMARVARPGGRVVVVDEELVEEGATLRDRLAFRLLTFYDPDPHAPIELLPEGVGGVGVEAIGRFYYCLWFDAPS